MFAGTSKAIGRQAEPVFPIYHIQGAFSIGWPRSPHPYFEAAQPPLGENDKIDISTLIPPFAATSRTPLGPAFIYLLSREGRDHRT